ncbi:MAG: O-antigen ligase family protein, partial [Lachnospiraceae bacterium]|nr:O-antigen ligase family protein [Lachnospiraceae bacterium]
FLCIGFLSYRISPYRTVGLSNKADGEWFYEGSLYGAKGWFMGFILFAVLIFLYFAISRFFQYSSRIWIPILIVSSVEFLWGMLNRYGVYPIEMEFGNSSFISSFGNINWFAGFVSVIAPIVVGLFYSSKSKLQTCLLILPLVFSHGMVLLNNSDSIVFGYVIMFYVLFLYSLDAKEKVIRFSRVLLSFTTVGMVLFFIDKAFPVAKEGTSAFADIFSKGFTAVLIFVLSLVFVAVMNLCDGNKLNYSEKVGKKIRTITLILSGAVFALVVILIIVNTATGGALPVIGSSSVFYFDSEWGSRRGATWTSGAMLFKDLSFGRKLIGVGPDMFYFGLKDSDAAFAYATSVFGNSRLTNAHNELLTLLINVGILGVTAFIFAVVTAVKTFITSAKERPYIIIFALSVICYIANNMFSFEQITNTPFFFLVLSMGAAAVVRREGRERRETKRKKR